MSFAPLQDPDLPVKLIVAWLVAAVGFLLQGLGVAVSGPAAIVLYALGWMAYSLLAGYFLAYVFAAAKEPLAVLPRWFSAVQFSLAWRAALLLLVVAAPFWVANKLAGFPGLPVWSVLAARLLLYALGAKLLLDLPAGLLSLARYHHLASALDALTLTHRRSLDVRVISALALAGLAWADGLMADHFSVLGVRFILTPLVDVGMALGAAALLGWLSQAYPQWTEEAGWLNGAQANLPPRLRWVLLAMGFVIVAGIAWVLLPTRLIVEIPATITADSVTLTLTGPGATLGPVTVPRSEWRSAGPNWAIEPFPLGAKNLQPGTYRVYASGTRARSAEATFLLAHHGVTRVLLKFR